MEILGQEEALNQYTVFIIEDEEDIAELIRYNLQVEGFNVEVFHSGEAMIKALSYRTPDLFLLDQMLPGMSGTDICKWIRNQTDLATKPVIMVTAKGEEQDVVKGLGVGADDYIVKPFSPMVLRARVSAVLRRSQGIVETVSDSHSDSLIRGDIEIHVGRHEVMVKSQKIDLTQSEFKILHFLAQRPGWVFTRGQIVEAIRGDNYAVTDRSIDFQMVGLRKKLGDHGVMIETVRGVGYRFKEIVT